MPNLNNKRSTKVFNFKAILISIIILLDIFVLPWIIKFPSFVIKYGPSAASKWLGYGLIKSMYEVATTEKLRYAYLILQLMVGALILAIAWNVKKIKKKSKKKDGIGGPESAGEGQHGTSRWMTEQEKDDSCTIWYTNNPIGNSSGIIIGMDKINDYSKVWFDAEDIHTLIYGATRSGKSRKIILPTIWTIAQSGESMVLGDPKGELYIYTKEYLESQGYNVIVLNFREPLKGNQWNILEPVTRAVDEGDIAKAVEIARDIANIIANQNGGSNSDPIWQNGEESTITALILLAALETEFKFQRHMTTVYYLLAEYGIPLEDETVPLNNYIESLPTKHPAKAAFAVARIAPLKTRGSFFTTALSDLRLFSDPTISDMTSKMDHSLSSIGTDKTAVFLIVPDEKATRNVLATLYIDQLYQTLVDLSNKQGGRIPRRVNMILDEFGNLPAIPHFEKKLTVAGGRGVRFTVAIQDFSQLEKLYGKSSKTLTGNFHNWLYLLTADIETAKIISERTGAYTVQVDNANMSVQDKGFSFGSGAGLAGRPLLMPDEVTRWPAEKNLVLRVRNYTAEYPLPDLSKWQANEDFGFHPTDRSYNQNLIKERWEKTKARELEDVSIWLPDLNPTEEEDKNVKENKPEIKINNEEPIEIIEIVDEKEETHDEDNTFKFSDEDFL